MHIWFGFACARDKATLERETKLSHIVEIKDIEEFQFWLGKTMFSFYDLFFAVEKGVDDYEGKESDLRRLVFDPRWMELLSFGISNREEARKNNTLFSYILIECGEYYHDLVNDINKMGLKIHGDTLRFGILDESGCSKIAKPILVIKNGN